MGFLKHSGKDFIAGVANFMKDFATSKDGAASGSPFFKPMLEGYDGVKKERKEVEQKKQDLLDKATDASLKAAELRAKNVSGNPAIEALACKYDAQAARYTAEANATQTKNTFDQFGRALRDFLK